MSRPLRILIGKPGLDGHDRGAKVVARALRDAGMEVIYTGLHQRPEDIVRAAIQEDVDAVGLSLLSGAHMTLVPEICKGLRAEGAADMLVFCGGIIPQEDIEALRDVGVHHVFGPGTPTDDIVSAIRSAILQDNSTRA
ncbi:MAG: cobalamin B12-binding domain-containing protein [Candidatus Sericytochromatia bacterium]|nr:cobalamin B12-binding domain-containing protein [Candidatus Sericytochromatia bacterium]